jgi:hypothetical protein
MFAKSASLLPGTASTRRRSSSRDRRPRAGLFTAKGLFQRKYDDRHDEELDPVCSSSSEESETNHDPKVRPEDFDDDKKSVQDHENISESSSGDTSSSEETAGGQSMEQSMEQSVIYVESEDDDEAGVSGILQMGCMDGFFMPGRVAAAKKSLIELNEKGDKQLKFNMKMPIAMGFRNEVQKERSEQRDTVNHHGTKAEGRRHTLRSVLNCTPDTPRNINDNQEALEGHSLPSIRQQPTMDPPAKIAGEEPSEQFKSIMSLSHDGSSGDDDSHFNVRTENLILPPPPPPPFHMHGQSQYMQHGMLQGPPIMHHPAMWHHQHMHHPHQPPVTVNNTYEMLVVNGMIPQQQHPLAYGAQQNYWNYMHNPALPHLHRPLEPPAIEKLPSQILVQKEDQTIGEDSSCLSYEHVPIASPSSSGVQYQQFGSRLTQNSRQLSQINARNPVQTMPMQNTLPLKPVKQMSPQTDSSANHSRSIPAAVSSRTEDSSTQAESDDDFQDSVQVLLEDQITQRIPKHDDKSCSTGSSGGEKPPRVQRWRQANLRRLKGPSPSTWSKPSVVQTVSSTGSKSSSSPSFDESTVRQTKEEGESVAYEIVAEGNGDENDDDDDETIDSEMATVDTEQMQQAAKNKKVKLDSIRLQPVQEEDTGTSIEGGSTESESHESEASSTSDSSVSETIVSSSPTPDGRNVNNGLSEAAMSMLEHVTEIKEAAESLNVSELSSAEEVPTDQGNCLMFDSIYTRRRERRDAAKLKMSKFLETKKVQSKTVREIEKQDVTRTTTRISRLSKIVNLTRSSTKESENTSPTSQENIKVSPKKDIFFSTTPQRENKILPPTIDKAGHTDAVLQPILDVPGFNSPDSRVPRGSEAPPLRVFNPTDSNDSNLQPVLDVTVRSSPSKRSSQGPDSSSSRVSKSPMARTTSVDNNMGGIKISWSLKPTMTCEFQDAFSTASSNVSSTSSASHRGREMSRSNSGVLQIQPTVSNEWHDAVDTQSPSSGSVASYANKQQHLEMAEESLQTTDPPVLNISRTRMGSKNRNIV